MKSPVDRFVSEISREDKRASSCDGKECFESMSLAMAVANRPNRLHCRRSPYRCQHCGGYHLGTPSLSKKRRRR